MAKWTIYNKSGEAVHESVTEYNSDGEVVAQDTLEYSGKWMGECYVTVSIKSAYPINFQIGDYIIYRDEKFVLDYDPSVVKKSSRGTYGEGFVYDSIKFNSLSGELTQMQFHDWVLSDNQLHYTSLPTFSFYCKDVDDLVDRLQANTDRWCKANGYAKEDYWVFYTLKNNTTGTTDSGQTQTYYERTLQRAKDISTDETFLATVKSNWEKAYGIGTAYSDSRDDERYDRTISASSQTVWDMMSSIKQQFGLNFIIRGRNVYVGTSGIPTDHIFRYGKDKGLYEVDKNAEQDQSVVTKLHAYGSNENLPTRYYAEVDSTSTPFAKITVGYITYSPNDTDPLEAKVRAVLDLSWSDKYFNDSVTDDTWRVGVRMNDIEVEGSVYESDNAVCLNVTYAKNDGDDESVLTFIRSVKAGETIEFTSGINKDTFPSDHKETSSSQGLPNNMAVNSLMLPGFPTYALSEICKSEYDSANDVTKYYIRKTSASTDWVNFHEETGNHTVTFSGDRHDPYILSRNAEKIGIKEGDISCTEDNDDNGLEKVYPTIEKMTGADAGLSTAGRLDEVAGADVIDDNGVFPKDYEEESIDGFKIYLPELGFDLRQAAKDAGGSDMKISMKDGFCGGRTFDVAQAKLVDGQWQLSCKRLYDDSLDLWFPYSYAKSVSTVDSSMTGAYQIQKGDHYVITGIYVSDVNYVWAASVKLLRKAIHWLCKNDYTKNTYSPKIDEIYMAKEAEDAKAKGETSLHDSIKEGDILLFQDDDLLLDGKVFIDQLTIKENGNNGIPTYDVTLRDEVTIGTLERIQNKVDSIANDVKTGNIGSGTTSPTQVESLIRAYGSELFISKKYDDTASGLITFEKGIVSHGDVNVDGAVYMTGGLDVGKNMEVGGYAQFDDDVNIDENLSVLGDTTTKNLTVTGQAHFFELVIDKIKAAGGSYIFSAANSFNVMKVVEGTNVLRLYWLAESGGSGSMNTWEVGDQAISMDFNRAKVGTTYEASNKYWWAKVTATSGNTPESIEEDGVAHDYHWIEVSTTEKADGCTVTAEVGDAVAQWGSQSDDPKRQGAIMICAYKSPDAGVQAPCFVEYTGINSFTITDANRKNKIAYDETVLKGSFTAISEKVGERSITEWLESLQTDADTHFDIWYGEAAPTLENEPAVEWTTDSKKAEHVGDLYFDRSDTAKSDGGHCYRFTATTTDDTTTYAWEDYTDQDTLKALTKAQNIADDDVISAGTEKAQLLIMRKNIQAEFNSFPEPTDSSKQDYTLAYGFYETAYNNFMTKTKDFVSEANLNTDTVLSKIGMSATEYVTLYNNYYATLATLRKVNDSNIKASISTVDGKVSLRVTKGELQTAGLTVEDAHIILDAAKTTVTGDLTVQGAITDSTSYVGMDGTLWSPNNVGELEKSSDNLLVTSGNGLFVPIDMTTIKSVQIQTTDPSAVSDGSPTSNIPALVTLPMYDETDLGCVVNNASVKIPAYRRSGTHVLIRNAFSLSYNQWSKGDGWTNGNLRMNIASAAVYICSDPRTLALSNYVAEAPVVSPDARDANGKLGTADWFKGRMYLNGRAGRWLCLLPGQQVELVSVVNIWQTGSNDPVPYLGWYVVGGDNMDWLEKTIYMQPPTTGYHNYDAVFRSVIDGGEHFGVNSADKYHDAFFGYTQLSDTSSLAEKIVVTLTADNKPYITIEQATT
jgi:hypothetical protein